MNFIVVCSSMNNSIFIVALFLFPIRRKLLRFSHHLSSSHGGRGLWLLRPWTIVAFLCNDIQTSGLKTLPLPCCCRRVAAKHKNKTVRSCIIHVRERCKKLSERIAAAATSSLKENAPPTRLGNTSQPDASLTQVLCVAVQNLINVLLARKFLLAE